MCTEITECNVPWRVLAILWLWPLTIFAVAALARRNKIVDTKQRLDYAILGAMQDPEITARQQEMATSVDHDEHARGKTPALIPKVVKPPSADTEQFSPDSIAAPLFCNPELRAAGWNDRPPMESSAAASVTSSMVRNAPSLVASSVVLPTRDAIKNAAPTWAPAPPGLAAAPLLDVAPVRPFLSRRRRHGSAVALYPARARSEA